MNKRIRLVMLGLLCSGLLLTGIGIGVAFVEYSGFTYAGERIPSSAQTETSSFTVPLDPAGKPMRISSYSTQWSALLSEASVQTSEAVTPGTVRIDMAYKTIGAEPAFWVETQEDPEAPDFVHLAWGSRSDLATLMALKDTVLEDLQNHRIGDYQVFLPLELTITVHPDNAAQVSIN